MLQIGDIVEVTNIRGKSELKYWLGKPLGMSIYIGRQGKVVKIKKEKSYDAVVELDDGYRLGFKESELSIIETPMEDDCMPDDNVIYAQVLLLDNKIENWKICQSKKRGTFDFNANWKRERLSDYTMETIVYKAEEVEVPEGWGFNSYVYNVLGPRWVNQWEYADDYKLGRSREESLEQYINEVRRFEDMVNAPIVFVEQDE